ncbi:MAG: antitoxin VapB family protein [bacterium]|nr:antitoxin VapB family protein [bacterium]
METFINLNIDTHSMATKTITVTEEAYRTLATMKQKNESFSQTILRVGKRRPLSDFYGILKGDAGERLEKAVKERRKESNKLHQKKMQTIIERLESKK